MKDINIKALAQELKPFKPIETMPVFLFKKLLPIFVTFALASYFMFFEQEILAKRWHETSFILQNTLWALVALGSFVAFYNSAFPQRTLPSAERMALGALGVIVGFQIYYVNYSQLVNEFTQEFSLIRGGCGVIISAMAIGYWWVLHRWAKQGAPRDPARTGLWSSLSASASGCLLMQAMCWNDGTLHVALWHFLPLTLSCYFGPIASKKWLKW